MTFMPICVQSIYYMREYISESHSPEVLHDKYLNLLFRTVPFLSPPQRSERPPCMYIFNLVGPLQDDQNGLLLCPDLSGSQNPILLSVADTI